VNLPTHRNACQGLSCLLTRTAHDRSRQLQTVDKYYTLQFAFVTYRDAFETFAGGQGGSFFNKPLIPLAYVRHCIHSSAHDTKLNRIKTT
jgi:hypothetical protein